MYSSPPCRFGGFTHGDGRSPSVCFVQLPVQSLPCRCAVLPTRCVALTVRPSELVVSRHPTAHGVRSVGVGGQSVDCLQSGERWCSPLHPFIMTHPPAEVKWFRSQFSLVLFIIDISCVNRGRQMFWEPFSISPLLAPVCTWESFSIPVSPC